RAGHKVLGATWDNDQTIVSFSHYIAHIGAEGMIATTWGKENAGHIMALSAEAFWNANTNE
ncbi:MAG: hypothetical protein PHS37_05415, partial [Candidatus Omnitrophica bacterium]|nr:hypothetical protein [Candidatus Omnitrophota bacterium]